MFIVAIFWTNIVWFETRACAERKRPCALSNIRKILFSLSFLLMLNLAKG